MKGAAADLSVETEAGYVVIVVDVVFINKTWSLINNNLNNKDNSLLRANKFFVLHSIFRNSDFAELTRHSEMKRKTSFPFSFHSFFRNFE